MITWFVPAWKKAPFLRLLPPLIAGIIIQWYLSINTWILLACIITSLLILVGYSLIKFSLRFRFTIIGGICSQFLFAALGALLLFNKHIHNNPHWFGKKPKVNAFECMLSEPPVEKQKSWKAIASVKAVMQNDRLLPASGKFIIYFEKKSFDTSLTYGSRIVFKKNIQVIHNNSNPGGFDYQRYSLFQGITHQVFLRKKDYEIVSQEDGSKAWHFIYRLRNNILEVLREAIQGEKELGLAEALLIGYKDDLDKSLVQSYSNTGVVHVIAISGLHLGLIYGLLIFICRPILKKKKTRWLHPFIIIACLWIFTLLAGAQPSVLRSAVMFTCIVIGKSINRQNHIYNSLAFSAFILLCINPFWLWDLGFQLSYAAVLSIVLFMKPIYNLLFIKNKILDLIWQLNAVTLSAQLLTIPVSIYHFHQFPNYFLLANLIAVPLSSLILFGEILLLIISPIQLLVENAGKILSSLIRIMNSFVEIIDNLPYSRLQHLQINSPQMWLMYAFILCILYGFILRSGALIKFSLTALFAFVSIRSISFYKRNHQAAFIVYNAANHKAMDFIIDDQFHYRGDSSLKTDFYLSASRTFFRAHRRSINQPQLDQNLISFGHNRILILDTIFKKIHLESNIIIDLLIISGARVKPSKNLLKSLIAKKMVIDAHTPAWTAFEWEKICDSLKIPCHNVARQGAFVMNLH